MSIRLSPAALREQIATGRLQSLYVITGQDEAEKASLAAAFVDAVEPDLRAFNVERMYGGETDARTIVDAVRTLPMLAPRRIVIVVQAERLLIPRREGEATARGLEMLEDYLEAPLKEATLVFVADALDKRRRVVKLLYAQAAVVECGEVVFADEADAWVRGQVAKAGMRIEREAVRLLVDRAGFVRERDWAGEREEAPGDIGRLRADTERASLYAAERKQISLADVREVVGPETSQDAWAFVNLMREGQTAAALRELQMVLAAGGVPFMILGQIRSFVATSQKRRTLPPQALPAAVEALFRTDLALKSSAGDPRVLLERLVVDLCERVTRR